MSWMRASVGGAAGNGVSAIAARWRVRFLGRSRHDRMKAWKLELCINGELVDGRQIVCPDFSPKIITQIIWYIW
jgi:hypothetical protein